MDIIVPDDHRDLLKRLESRLPGERIDAEETIKMMGPEGVELLLEVINTEKASITLRKRWCALLVGTGLGFAVLIAVLLAVTGHQSALPGLAGFAGLAGLSGVVAPSKRYRLVIELIANSDDPRCIGPLAGALFSRDRETRIAMSRAIYRLLPSMTPEIADLLTTDQREKLRKLLFECHPDKEHGLALRLIRGIDLMNDFRALHVLDSVGKKRATTIDGQEVVRAALEVKTRLEAEHAKQETPKSLLRASSQTTPQEQLLRPTTSQSETPAEQLLRAQD